MFDPANFPTSKDDLVLYGMDEVTILSDHFSHILDGQGCNRKALQKEWVALKLDIYRHHMGEKFFPLWKKFLTSQCQSYVNILHLVRIILVCPVATAQVERMFSFIKRILGDWRLSLHLDTVDTLLRIAVDGPPVEEFDPTSSIHKRNEVSMASRPPDNFPLHPEVSKRTM